jgi:hypothetical protein
MSSECAFHAGSRSSNLRGDANKFGESGVILIPLFLCVVFSVVLYLVPSMSLIFYFRFLSLFFIARRCSRLSTFTASASVGAGANDVGTSGYSFT